MSRRPLAVALARAAADLAQAGVPSPRTDAELLAAHLLGVSRAELARLAVVGAGTEPEGYADLVAERAARTPLQHLTGRAPFRTLDLAVGPGVFVPRPETEVVAAAAIEQARAVAARGRPAVVVDLCCGSAAIALAVAVEAPGARVVAVEVSEAARAWAAANIAALAPGRVDLRAGDVTSPALLDSELADLRGQVDVVVSNPPYVPPGQQPVEPEVRDHDPHEALFGGGPDGLAIPRAVLALAAELLVPGGLLVIEHADVQGGAVLAALRRSGHWREPQVHDDLTGRPRFATARRSG